MIFFSENIWNVGLRIACDMIYNECINGHEHANKYTM